MLHGQTRFGLPSRFIDEIPPALTKWLTPKAGKMGFVAEPAMPTYAAQARRPSGGLRIGQNVRHAKFGQGVIVNAEGSGPDARVQVNFAHAGMKWLALSVAKLEAQ
jgi:DNA helicase-2/ATP-dependent DNA helicase PcrA